MLAGAPLPAGGGVTQLANFFGGPLLPVAWAAIMAFVIPAYVALDGFDLGVGILFAMERDKLSRDVMVNTIAPLWDGNQTWLVLGGSGLYGAFPVAYSVILPAFYPHCLPFGSRVFDLPADRAALDHNLGRRVTGVGPDIFAGRHRDPDPRDPRL